MDPPVLTQKVKQLYEKIGYGQQYGLDILLTVIIIVAFLCTIIYFYVIGHLKPIKAEWPINRCNPAYLPFAGIINPPTNGSAFDYTGENFEYCTQNILKDISGHFLAPLYYLMSVIQDTLTEMSKATNSIRSEFNKVRDGLSHITTEIMARVHNAVIPLTKMVINLRDMLGRVAGIILTGLYTFMAGYMGLNSAFKIIIDAMIFGLVLLGSLIPLLWATFMWPLAIADTAIFVIVLVAFIAFKSFLAEVMGIASGDAPPIPACFGKGTQVMMKDNITKSIEDIKIGDLMVDGGIVTGVMKMSSRAQILYDIGGIKITGRHRIYHPELGLIQVMAHPEAIRITDFREQYVYCINTSTKKLLINSEYYVDWDDLDPMDMYELETRCSNIGYIAGTIKNEDIHHYLECGLTSGSMIELDDGRSLPIEDIDVNDVLRFGETVLGIIKLDALDVVNVKEYSLDTSRSLRCSGNILIIDGDLGSINTHTIDGTQINDKSYLYQLITDTGTFVVDGVRIGDYNTGLEQHLKPSLFLSR